VIRPPHQTLSSSPAGSPFLPPDLYRRSRPAPDGGLRRGGPTWWCGARIARRGGVPQGKGNIPAVQPPRLAWWAASLDREVV